MGRAIVRAAAGLPVRRTAVEPRRQAARADPARDPEAAPRTRHHLAVRDARPGRGHDPGPAHHRDERRRDGPVRHARGGVLAPGHHLRGQLHRLAADEPAETRAGCAARRILGIRPEHLVLDTNGWSVQIEHVELLGAERLIYGRIGDEQLIMRADERHSRRHRPATPVKIAARPEKLHWFDAGSGKRTGSPRPPPRAGAVP